MMPSSLITIVIPSFNQGKYIARAIESVIEQREPVELYIMDGGSTDNSVSVIKRYERFITHWESNKDNGQASAINAGINKGNSKYVCWLNSDDWLLPRGLSYLIKTLQSNPHAPAAYGKAFNYNQATAHFSPLWVQPFSQFMLRQRCIVSQPATLIHRDAWDGIGGLNTNLSYALDYDLWWRLFLKYGDLLYTPSFIAVNRDHPETKTNTGKLKHYNEAIGVVKKYTGNVPIKWRVFQKIRECFI
jgi:hypothetical protein